MSRMLSTVLALLLMQAALHAQVNISTKKVIISDLPDKTMMVVQTPNAALDSLVASGFASFWRISPFEYCSADEFLSGASSDKYYYFLVSDGNSADPKMDGLATVSVFEGGFTGKGTPDKSDINSVRKALYKVIEVPLCKAGTTAPGIEPILGPVLTAIQKYVEYSIENDIVGYIGMKAYTNRPDMLDGKDVIITGPQEMASLMRSRAKDTVVSWIVCSCEETGGWCCNMLFDCESGELCGYFTHRIKLPKSPAGFLPKDLKFIRRHALSVSVRTAE